VVVAVTAILLLRGRSPNSYRVGCITPLTGWRQLWAATKRGLELARPRSTPAWHQWYSYRIVYEDDQMSARVPRIHTKLTSGRRSCHHRCLWIVRHACDITHRPLAAACPPTVQVHAQPRRGVERAPSGRACRACVLRRRPTQATRDAPSPAQATGRGREPITKGRGNLHAWQPASVTAGTGGATGVRTARPLCPGVASVVRENWRVLCGHRRRVADRTAGVRASGVCGILDCSVMHEASRTLRAKIATCLVWSLYLRRSWFLSHVLGRRMNQTTQNLLAHVVPAQPLRQWC